MGTCVSKQTYLQKPSKEEVVVIKKSKFSQLQEELLSKMYNDLAKRCKSNIVSRQTFEVFFHASGLMAELLFIKFDRMKSGEITKVEFLHAFQIMVKGSFQEKADALFDFYGVENSGGIRYSQLLKILFSYPLAQLNKMLFEDNFLKYLGDNMLTYYFGPQRKIEDKTIIEQTSEQSNNEGRKYSVYSVYAPSSNQYIEMQTRIKEMVEQGKNKKIGVPDIFKKQRHSIHLTVEPNNFQENKIGSTTQVQLKKTKKTAQLKSNIASVTKRYATYLFVSLNLDKEKDVFSKAHFYKLLKDHPSIFDAYLSGFHNYVWQVDADGSPEFQKLAPWIESSAKEIMNFNEEKIYLKFIKTTILVFPHKISKIPKDIINMEGLTALVIDTQDQYGIKLTHRDGIYPQREFIFDSKALRDDWMKQLADFKQNSIFDKYIKLQRIGGGNFSNVYKGKVKNKQSEKFVAIKVIQHLKLTESQRQVLKRQCGILKQCHHPNIVKYIEEFKTKTHLYIVTELLSQGDLFEYTRKNTFLEEYEAAIIFRQLADTILYLNESGIIHRDLKPENVMVIKDTKMVRRVKLIDFGFGVFKDKLKDLTDREKYAGTPGFIAPQVYQMKDYDEKIDTFSLGIILYFMLYGYLPFQSNYLQQIQEMTIICNITLRNNHWSNVSEEAKDLILKLLTHPEQRITTKQALDHPWLQDTEHLKQYQGRNKKQRILF